MPSVTHTPYARVDTNRTVWISWSAMSNPNEQFSQQPHPPSAAAMPPSGAAAMPPPIAPVAPTYSSCNHVLHLILSILTVGMWLFVWPLVYIAVTSNNKSKAKRYEEELKTYNRDYWQWQQSQQR